MSNLLDHFLSLLSAEKGGAIETEMNRPLSTLTTFRIGGPCDVAVFPSDRDALCRALEAARLSRIPYRVIGHGSNLLCSDEGYHGAVIVTDRITKMSSDGDTVYAECGASMSAVAKEAQRASLAGAEFLYGIPGTVGGGLYMNAGAYGGEIAAILSTAECFDTETGKTVTLSVEKMKFGYRHSIFCESGRYIVLAANFRLVPGKSDEIAALMKDLIGRRREKQPLEFPSAGSTFKRCEGHYVSKMIDEAGLKGRSVGGARVSEKHAGFVINAGGATAADVTELIRQVKDEVYRSHGVRIECEVEYLG